jgi:outer membrane protein OmpA-like peptidoglycan-associated protein
VTRRRTALLALAGAAAQGWAGLAAAQAAATPKPDEMVNALRPTRQRNLLVRPAPQPAAIEPVAADAPASAASVASTPLAAVPAPAPVAAPAEPPPSLSLALPFEVNSARLRPESGTVLGNLVAALLSPELKGQRFVIEGHTDASGGTASNLRLSQARADEVRMYLVALGVHPSRLRAVGKGSSEPANARDPLSADNRRVRVVTLE